MTRGWNDPRERAKMKPGSTATLSQITDIELDVAIEALEAFIATAEPGPKRAAAARFRDKVRGARGTIVDQAANEQKRGPKR